LQKPIFIIGKNSLYTARKYRGLDYDHKLIIRHWRIYSKENVERTFRSVSRDEMLPDKINRKNRNNRAQGNVGDLLIAGR